MLKAYFNQTICAIALHLEIISSSLFRSSLIIHRSSFLLLNERVC